MNRIFKISLFFIEIVMCFLILSGILHADCIIKQLFHISCPACGFTRAFLEILNLNLLEAMKYNLLSIPVFLLLLIVNAYLIYDIIKKQKKTEIFFEKLGQYIIPIVIILIINTIINNINGI